jgi:TrmH family RNA methyltransferase
MPEPAPLASHGEDQLGIILDRLADPGNAGTILRTADAAGVGYVVSLPGTVDLFSPKVVRAGMGAHFRVPLYADMSSDDVGSALPNLTWITTDAHSGASIYNYTWPAHAALVIGSEAHGLSAEVESIAHHSIRIPMRPGVESLNAAVAAAITIYSALGPEIEQP